MKKSILILLFGMLAFNTTYAQKYIRKTYPHTKMIDEYFDVADLTKEHTVGADCR
ncbi:hypothetical protein AAKU52_000221 [Pedobacter sp. CG_S7]